MVSITIPKMYIPSQCFSQMRTLIILLYFGTKRRGSNRVSTILASHLFYWSGLDWPVKYKTLVLFIVSELVWIYFAMSASPQLSSRIKTDSKCMKCQISTKTNTCDHTFCLQCFNQYHGGGTNEAECLLCMMRSAQSDGKPLDPHTFYFCGESSEDKQLDEPEQMCEVCSRWGIIERNSPVTICRQCQIKMCYGCFDCHRVLNLDQIALTNEKCKVHPEKDITDYCYQCESGHCDKNCAVNNCSTKPINDAASELKEKLRTAMNDIENSQLLVAGQEYVLSLQDEELREMFKLQEKKIHNTSEQVVGLVNKHISCAITQLESQKRLSSKNIDSLRVKLLTEKSSLRSLGLFARDILDKGNPFVLASSVKNLSETAETLKRETNTKAEAHADSFFLPSDDSDYYKETGEVSSQIFRELNHFWIDSFRFGLRKNIWY